jgi:hypothetical protein
MKTEYFIYDERYYSDPDSAIVYEVCETLKEARRNGPDYGGFVIVKTVGKKTGKRSYEVVSSEIVN